MSGNEDDSEISRYKSENEEINSNIAQMQLEIDEISTRINHLDSLNSAN